jgi:hypothetical protein
MKNGQWYVEFTIEVRGENSVRDPVRLSENIRFEFDSQSEEEAEKKALHYLGAVKSMAKDEDYKFLRKYCKDIDDEDRVSFSGFKLFYEKNLDYEIPDMVGGP